MRIAYRTAREGVSRLVVDERLGIETAKRVSDDELYALDSRRVPYEASPWLALRRGLAGCRIGPDDVLIDLGCGKGRVLVLAARYPFRRVVGVELSPELAHVARANLARAPRSCGEVEVVCADVKDYGLPDDVTIIYMYNPFRGEIFSRALAAIVESLERAPRRVTILYRSPFEHDRLIGSGRFRLVRTRWGIVPRSVGSSLRIYESV